MDTTCPECGGSDFFGTCTCTNGFMSPPPGYEYHDISKPQVIEKKKSLSELSDGHIKNIYNKYYSKIEKPVTWYEIVDEVFKRNLFPNKTRNELLF